MFSGVGRVRSSISPTPLGSLQLVPVTRIEQTVKRMGSEKISIQKMNGDQQVDGGRKEDHRESSGNDEVVLNSHDRGADAPDPLGSDIHDAPESSDDLPNEWLFETGPPQGARLKWIDEGRPPVGLERATDMDIGAAGGTAGRNMEQHSTPVPVLPTEQQILQEEEVNFGYL